ncbi:hypothetical protein GCK72_017492 [Caenorhabditis remanei]|uniref:Uncharacterized protein n=1 Tax=Caenorhabditis remanei TaxID=31234 RepID=A0A6A5G882_CAERE|nr:hypothetical protein GCK72_017492 [Caenorhabditis remanei]KAF1750941.1 hypothetical protein GCK72_017492 [Caenorhabditis remanei]
MDVFTVLTPIIVIAFLLFLTLRLIIKYCKPSSSAVVSSSSTDTEAPDFTRVANHLFVSNTPHTYSRIYVDEAANVRSVTITRISPPGQHIVAVWMKSGWLIGLCSSADIGGEFISGAGLAIVLVDAVTVMVGSPRYGM